jgi:hypothetical protein
MSENVQNDKKRVLYVFFGAVFVLMMLISLVNILMQFHAVSETKKYIHGKSATMLPSLSGSVHSHMLASEVRKCVDRSANAVPPFGFIVVKKLELEKLAHACLSLRYHHAILYDASRYDVLSRVFIEQRIAVITHEAATSSLEAVYRQALSEG